MDGSLLLRRESVLKKSLSTSLVRASASSSSSEELDSLELFKTSSPYLSFTKQNNSRFEAHCGSGLVSLYAVSVPRGLSS